MFGRVVRQHIMAAVHDKPVYLMVGEQNQEEEAHFPIESMPPWIQDIYLGLTSWKTPQPSNTASLGNKPLKHEPLGDIADAKCSKY